MKPIRNLKGQKFCHLQAIRPIGKDSNGKIKWLCVCDCGKEKTARTNHLTRGLIRSCGCSTGQMISSKKTKLIDLSGRKFSRWTVVKKSPNNNSSRHGWRWSCVCECGVEKEVSGDDLRDGGSKSCGCLARELRKAKRGEKNTYWKGGRYITKEGYILVHAPEYEGTKQDGHYVREHALVMSKHLGRPLRRGETVHHKNGIKGDNRLENLELWSHSHPPGQRIEDKIKWCEEFLSIYKPEALAVHRSGSR